MPGMDGVELCRAVRAMQLDGYVFILLLTARDSKENIIGLCATCHRDVHRSFVE